MANAETDAVVKLPDTQPLNVILRRRAVRVGRWDATSWKLEGVDLAGDGPLPGAPTVEGDRVVHHGILLRLYRDQVDDYHYNLSSATPRLFVVCSRDSADDTLEPRLATLSQLEAVDYMEAEGEVLSCPLAGEVRDWVEAWTLLSPVRLSDGKKKRRHRSAPSE